MMIVGNNTSREPSLISPGPSQFHLIHMVGGATIFAIALLPRWSSVAFSPVSSQGHTHDAMIHRRRFRSRGDCNARPPNANIPHVNIFSHSRPSGDQETTNSGGEDPTVEGVTLKMAFDSSPEWGVADLSETKSERFTSPESLDMVHRLRRESSAVLVGRGTVEKDDCSLTVRRVKLNEGQSQPIRVVLDPTLSILGGRKFTLLKDGLSTIIYHSSEHNEDGRHLATSPDVDLVEMTTGASGSNCLSPREVLRDLESRGLRHIMVEGGPATARAFLEAGVVDRAILVRAPVQFQIPVPAEMNEETLGRAGLEMIGSGDMGGDTIEYWVRKGSTWPAGEWP